MHIIRRARTSDLCGILQVIGQVLPDHGQNAEGYEAAIQSASMLVVETEGQIVGFGLLRGHYIEQIYFHPGNQGQGTGSELLMKLEALALERRIVINVNYFSRWTTIIFPVPFPG